MTEDFSKFISAPVLNGEWDLVLDEIFYGCYGFQLFNEEICDKIINTAEKKNLWNSGQRETNKDYSTHDMLLSDIGNLDILYNHVLFKIVYPAIIHAYHLEDILGDQTLDQRFSPESFIAKYTPDNQAHLGLHHDFSSVTTMLTLNNQFEGGGTWFFDAKKLVKSKAGYMIFHQGMFTHYHGARPVTKGSRYVIITFNNWI